MLKLNLLAFKNLFDQLTNEDQADFVSSIPNLNVNLFTHCEVLCNYIYRTFSIDHFVYKDKKYYELQNTCMLRDDNIQIDAIDCVKCTGEYDCKLECSVCNATYTFTNTGLDDDDDDTSTTPHTHKTRVQCTHMKHINIDNPEEIQYVLDYKSTDISPEDYEEGIAKFYEFIENHGKQIKIVAQKECVNYNSIRINNISGYNEDHRGSTHCKIAVPFEQNIIIKLPCTLYDFAVALYRIKSHKWDSWYEMYGDATIRIPENDIEVPVVHVEFDHGS